MVKRPGPSHGWVSPAVPGRDENMPSPAAAGALPKKSGQALGKRGHGQRNGTFHQLAPRDSIVAQSGGGQTVLETDWETWQLSGQPGQGAQT